MKHSQIKQSASNSPQGVIVAGEAPESDEEREEGNAWYSVFTSSVKFNIFQSFVSVQRR